MRQLPLTKAVERLRSDWPYQYAHIVSKRARFLRLKVLTTFASIAAAISKLQGDDLIAAMRLLPYLDKRRATAPLLSLLKSARDPTIQLEAAKTLGTLSARSTTILLMESL